MIKDTVETRRVLVISHEAALLQALLSCGESNSWHVETAASGWEAMERVQSDVAPHLLLLDVARGDGDSLHILRWLRRLRPELPVVVCCYPDANRPKEATRLGAEAVVVRPFDEPYLESVIRQHLDAPRESLEMDVASDDVESVGEDEFFLSVGPVMQKLRAQAELLAQADVPVLIVGEPGSGKGTVARLIHKLSIHSGFSFSRVNCAAMPAELLEIELFGRTKDIKKKDTKNEVGCGRLGKLELGERGTLLLEEITEMPLALQSKIFQVLQNNQFVRCGEDQPITVDVRILATTSANLDRALAEKRLREDLYYRLSAFTVHVPPLRQRKNEIKVLLQYSMHKLAHHYGLPPREFTAPVLSACLSHSWPGNLQELETFVKRYLVMGDKELRFGGEEPYSDSKTAGSYSLQNLRLPLVLDEEVDADSSQTGLKSLRSLIQSVKSEAEKNAIAAALEKTAWNRKAAARLLRVSYRTLLYKIEQYHMNTSEPYISPFPGPAPASRRNGKAR